VICPSGSRSLSSQQFAGRGEAKPILLLRATEMMGLAPLSPILRASGLIRQGVICFAISQVAENDERKDRQRPNHERYPKPNPARSSTLPSHL
jgi:hypothetical protein